MIPVVLWLQSKPIICSAVSSSLGLSGRFHRSGPECSFTPLFVLWSVLALRGEFLCFLFMTGNAHHKSLVSTYISAGIWACRMKKGHYHEPTQTCREINTHSCTQSEGRSAWQRHIQAGSRGTLTETAAPGPCTRVSADGGQSVTL